MNNYKFLLCSISISISVMFSIDCLDMRTRALLESEVGQLFMAQRGYELLKNQGPEELARSFSKQFNNGSIPDLIQFFTRVQAAEKQFFSQSADQPRSYSQLLTTLEKYKTPVGTTLAHWAVRFLTLDALLLAQAEPTTPTDDLARVVTEQFIDALLALQRRYNFSVSSASDLDTVIFQKIRRLFEQYRAQ